MGCVPLAVRWGLGAVGAAVLWGAAPAGSDVVCYEREVTVEATTGCVNVTLMPQRTDSAAQQQLRAEHQAELARQKDALLKEYTRQCSQYLEEVKQQGDQLARLEREAGKMEAYAERRGERQQCDVAMQQVTRERDRLQAAAAETAAHPGGEALAAFPDGAARGRLAGFGMLAALGGFLLGLPGRSRWLSKFFSGLVAALLALFAYFGLVAYLPDTQSPHLLLACTAALLLLSLRTLLRAYVLLRQRQ